MAHATVTVRELKNKDTGIDLSVTSFKETKGYLGSSYEYQLMVVSNLMFFKTAKHKDTDNVQFTIFKKLSEFEDLHSKFNMKYSGTVFPLLPKKVLLMNEGVAKERRNSLDFFVKFLASTQKLCTDQLLLEFLGVQSAKAEKLKKIEVELKNKDTGIDLSVTSFKETKGYLGSSYEYQLMVVSNLMFFKTAKHKDTDNVQFTIFKKLSEFEDLHSKFNMKYSGTVFPLLPKKVLLMNEGVAKKRRNSLDFFVKFLASTQKLCTDQLLLEFLGVQSAKAEKLKKIEVSESIVNKEDMATEVATMTESEQEPAVKDDPNDKDDLFGDAEQSDDEEVEEDLFAADEITADAAGDLKIFDEPDLSGALQEGEGEELFIAGARSEVKVKSIVTETEEPNDDLFSENDDLDKIMEMKLTKTGELEEVSTDTTTPVEEMTTEQNNDENVLDGDIESDVLVVKDEPALNEKPKPAVREKPKPSVTDKPKPALREKPKPPLADKPKPPVTDKPKPVLKDKPKPALRKKPDLKPKPGETKVSVSSSISGSGDITDIFGDSNTAETITQDDILKYIQENTQEDVDDLDLFS